MPSEEDDNNKTDHGHKIYQKVDSIGYQHIGPVNVYPDSAYVITYDIVKVNQSNLNETLNTIAAKIDVKTHETGFEYNNIPFVEYDGFENLMTKDKLILLAPSGSGKSRSIIELLTKRVNELDSIYIINPKDVRDPKRISLEKLVNNTASGNNAIVWDNFPDDLSKAAIIEHGLEALAIVSSNKVKNVILALSPKYLQKYEGNIGRVDENLYVHRIRFNQIEITKIIESYGESITELREVYYKLIKPNLHAISRILYRKEPTPFYVHSYLSSLTSERKKTQKRI
jgi:hypothetical protein